jgi:cold shock CspA family protein
MNGTVKSIVSKKEFGFIEGEDKKEYFFHRDDFSGFWEDLESDVNVRTFLVKITFTPEIGKEGPRAGNVSRVDWPNQAVSEIDSSC